jgi:hypothetical protein
MSVQTENVQVLETRHGMEWLSIFVMDVSRDLSSKLLLSSKSELFSDHTLS